MKKINNFYRADDSKMFVLTKKGKKEVASWKNDEVGKPVDEDKSYAVSWAIEEGYLVEKENPRWIVCNGYSVVYRLDNGIEIHPGNKTVFLTREEAEKYKEHYEKKSWFDEKLYIIDDVYEGEKPDPYRRINEKNVYNKYYNIDLLLIGDYVEDDVVEDLMNVIEPVSYSNSCAQVGEPSNIMIDDLTGNPRNVYITFRCVDNDTWEYCGNCFKGENVERGKNICYV